MSLFSAVESDPQKSNRNIVVIGSTGRTGRLVLEEGLRRGHMMTAFTRRPDTLAGVNGLRSVVTGGGRRGGDMRGALGGQNAGISIVVSHGRGPTTGVRDVTRAGPPGMGGARGRPLRTRG